MWNPPPQGSNGLLLASIAKKAKVVKGFNTFGLEIMKMPQTEGVANTVLFATDHADAKDAFTSVVSAVGFKPVYAGPLRNSACLENMACVWIHLALVGGQGRHFNFNMVDCYANPALKKPKV